MELTVQGAQALVERHRPGWVVRGVTRLSGGLVSAVYRLQGVDEQDALVLKCYPDSGEPTWMREREVYRLIAERAPQVPMAAVLGHGDGGAADPLPRPYLLMQVLPGRAVARAQEDLGPTGRRVVYEQIGRILQALHSIAMPGFGDWQGPDAPLPHASNQDFIQARFDDRLGRFLRSGGDAALHARMAAVARRAGPLLAACTQARLCHGDYNENNVFVRRHEGQWLVSGLIDFEHAQAADPLLDVAKITPMMAHSTARRNGFKAGYGPLPGGWRERCDIYELQHQLALYAFNAHRNHSKYMQQAQAGMTAITTRLEAAL